MALYSEKVMDHFRNPRNVGVIENADGVGEVGNAKCGDIMKMYLKIDDDITTKILTLQHAVYIVSALLLGRHVIGSQGVPVGDVVVQHEPYGDE